jgi:Protein of unknown function (DUF1570)
MSLTNRSTAISAVLGLCALPLLVSLSSSTGPTEKEFEEQLGVVERTIAAGKWKEAKALLLAALDKHKDATYVLYHLTEIKDDLERCAFWSVNAKPNPKDHISGNLIAYSASSGQIDLRYEGLADKSEPRDKAGARDKSKGSPSTGENSGGSKSADGARTTLGVGYKDFSDERALHVHPLVFDGPYKIALHGNSYPALYENAHPPVLVVCADWDQGFAVSFGLPEIRNGKESHWLPARIVHVQEGESTTLDEAIVGVPSGMPYDLEVVVTTTSITANINGKKLLSCNKPATVFGRFGFENCPEVNKITISGKVQPSWLQGVVDTAVQEKWSAFDAQYKFRDELPDWLKERVKPAVPARTSLLDSYPGPEHAKGREQLAHLDGLFMKNDLKGALAYVAAIPESDATPPMRAWLGCVLAYVQDKSTPALESCRRVIALDPGFFAARDLEIKLVSELDSPHAAVERCRALTQDFKSEPRAYADLAMMQLLDDHFDDARATIRDAIDSGIDQSDLASVDHLLGRAVKGPTWTRSFEYKSEHYDVVSDINQSLCAQAAMLLEKFFRKYDVHLHHVPNNARRLFRVYLFSGEASYHAYTKDLLGREHKNTLGLYSPAVKQLLIWNVADTEGMFRVVRHEGFHQYLDRLVANAPRWLNEGMAKYFEVSRVVNGNWSDGEIQPDLVGTLHATEIIPLKDLMRLDGRSFYEDKTVALHYAESWALVHFFLNTTPDHKKRFDKYLDALFAGTKPDEATAKSFDDASLATLQNEFEAYVKGLK